MTPREVCHKFPNGVTALRHGYLGYGMCSGFGHGWLPEAIQHVIVSAWNHVVCFANGHDFILVVMYLEGFGTEPECPMCCTRLIQ